MTPHTDVAGVLDRIAWPRLFEWVTRGAGPSLRAWAAGAATHDGDLDPHHLLALLVTWGPPALVREGLAVAAQQALSRREHQTLHRWLADVTARYRPTSTAHRHATRAIPAASPPSPAGLVVHPALEPLPLRTLAGDAARLQPAGTLTVAADTLCDAYGIYLRQPTGGRILLDLEACRRDRHDWRETFRHELAHALDPDDAASLPVGERERFADDLAALLDEHRPTSLAGAEPLLVLALAHRQRHEALADEALDEILGHVAYAQLQLLTPAPA